MRDGASLCRHDIVANILAASRGADLRNNMGAIHAQPDLSFRFAVHGLEPVIQDIFDRTKRRDLTQNCTEFTRQHDARQDTHRIANHPHWPWVYEIRRRNVTERSTHQRGMGAQAFLPGENAVISDKKNLTDSLQFPDRQKDSFHKIVHIDEVAGIAPSIKDCHLALTDLIHEVECESSVRPVDIGWSENYDRKARALGVPKHAVLLLQLYIPVFHVRAHRRRGLRCGFGWGRVAIDGNAANVHKA